MVGDGPDASGEQVHAAGLLAAAADISVDRLVACSEGFQVTWCNAAAAAAGPAAPGQDLWAAFPVLGHPPFARAVHEAVSRGVPGQVEGRDAGSGAWLELAVRPAPGGGAVLRLRDTSDVRDAVAAVTRANERLRATESFVGRAMGASLSLIFEWDIVADAVVRHYSAEDARPPATPDERQRFEDIVALVHPEDQQRFRGAIAQALASPDGAYASTHRIVFPDGKVHWQAEAGRVEFAPDGRPLRLVGMSHRVTTGGQQDEALRVSEARYRALAEYQPVFLWELDPDGTPAWANERYHGFTGLDAAALRRGEWVALLHPDEAVQVVASWNAGVASRQPFEVEASIRHQASGEYRWFRWQGTPVFCQRGGLVRWVGTAADIHALKSALLAAQVHAERLHYLGAGLRDTVLYQLERWDGHLRFAWVSPNLQAVFGIDPQAAMADATQVFSLVHPQDRPALLAEVARSGQALDHFTCELRTWHPQRGQWRWMLLRSQPRPLQPGRHIWDGAAIDVTDRKHVELQLAQALERSSLARRAASIGIFEYDVPSRRLDLDSRARSMWHDAAPDAMDAPSLLATVHPDDLPGVEQELRRCMDSRSDGLCRMEFRVAGPQCGERWLSVMATAYFERGTARRLLGTVQDITGRKLADLDLQLARQITQDALGASRSGTFRWHVAADDLRWDDHLARLFGLAPAAAPRTLAQLLALVHPDDRAVLQAHSDRAVADGSSFDFPFRVLPPEGGERWLQCRGRAIAGHEGRTACVTGVCVDVTDRIATEHELARTAARLEGALRAGYIGIWELDLHAREMTADEGLLKLYGLGTGGAGERVPLADFLRATHPEDVPRVEAAIADAQRYGSTFFVEQRVRRGGGLSWIEARGRVLQDTGGRPVRITGVAVDVTARKLTEQLLSERERDLQALADNSPDVIARFDRQLRHTFINRAVERATGRPRAQFLGKTNRELGMPTPLCDAWDEATAQVFASGLPRELEFEFDAGDQVRCFLARLIPELRDGVVRSVLAVTRDVTEERRLERSLREQDRRKDEFLAVLAHELRNPLAPVVFGVEVLRRTAGLEAVPRAPQMLDMMGRQLAQMGRLVDDLLDVSRVNQGKIRFVFEPVPLQQVVAGALEACQAAIDGKGHRLVRHEPQAPVLVSGDQVRLVQALSNLVLNAAKYSEPGSTVTVTLEAGATDAAISVTDTGLGIDPAVLPTLWDMFTQVRDTVHRAQGGLGIGLSLVKSIVERHGGSVQAHSAGRGHGSTFTLRLPLGGPAPAGG